MKMGEAVTGVACEEAVGVCSGVITSEAGNETLTDRECSVRPTVPDGVERTPLPESDTRWTASIEDGSTTRPRECARPMPPGKPPCEARRREAVEMPPSPPLERIGDEPDEATEIAVVEAPAAAAAPAEWPIKESI